MAAREFHDGANDGLEALEPLDPGKIASFDDLLVAMSKTAFGGRRLGEAFEVLWSMIDDPDCKVVMTLSGAMTIAKMGKIISTMLDEGMVHCIISTGALIAHGLTESVGKTHYRHHPSMNDEDLFRKGYNRVYDTLEMEANLNYVEHVVARTLKRIKHDQPLSSETLTRELGKTLAEEFEGGGEKMVSGTNSTEPPECALVTKLSNALLAERTVTPREVDRRWHAHLYPIFQAERCVKSSFVSAGILRAGLYWPPPKPTGGTA